MMKSGLNCYMMIFSKRSVPIKFFSLTTFASTIPVVRKVPHHKRPYCSERFAAINIGYVRGTQLVASRQHISHRYPVTIDPRTQDKTRTPAVDVLSNAGDLEYVDRRRSRRPSRAPNPSGR